MIPRILHYCWFGRHEMPADIRGYMASWGRIMPDWQIVRWDEERMTEWVKNGENRLKSVGGNTWLDYMPRYVQEAYAAKKYAFVSDYVRLLALKEMGGIYLDVDVEVLRSFADLPELTDLHPHSPIFTDLHRPSPTFTDLHRTTTAFLGFEENKFHAVGTCVIGSEKGAAWLDEQLAYYQDRPFILEDGTYDMTTNTVIMSTILERHGLIRNGEEQVITVNSTSHNQSNSSEPFITDIHPHSPSFTDINPHSPSFTDINRIKIYDFHHFSPLTSTRVLRATKDTFAIHHYAESWKLAHEKRPYRSPVINEVINTLVQMKRSFLE